jgi:hypothetical protein
MVEARELFISKSVCDLCCKHKGLPLKNNSIKPAAIADPQASQIITGGGCVVL